LWDVPADAGFLCDKSAMHRDKIKDYSMQMGNKHLVRFRGRRNFYCILFGIFEGRGEDWFGNLIVGSSLVLLLILKIMKCVGFNDLRDSISLCVRNNAVNFSVASAGNFLVVQINIKIIYVTTNNSRTLRDSDQL
jgi:hypothetical protein